MSDVSAGGSPTSSVLWLCRESEVQVCSLWERKAGAPISFGGVPAEIRRRVLCRRTVRDGACPEELMGYVTRQTQGERGNRCRERM